MTFYVGHPVTLTYAKLENNSLVNIKTVTLPSVVTYSPNSVYWAGYTGAKDSINIFPGYETVEQFAAGGYDLQYLEKPPAGACRVYVSTYEIHAGSVGFWMEDTNDGLIKRAAAGEAVRVADGIRIGKKISFGVGMQYRGCSGCDVACAYTCDGCQGSCTGGCAGCSSTCQEVCGQGCNSGCKGSAKAGN